MKHFYTLLLLFTFNFGFSQQVETVASHPKIVDGLHVDEEGNVYTASGGLVGGNTIGKYTVSNDSFDAFFASGFFGTIDIDVVQDSLFIVTNFDNNSVSHYNRNTGIVSQIATSLDGPAGIAVDTNGNAFITNFGAPPAYTGHEITKITPSGNVSVYIDSSVLFRLQAICFNHNNELVVHSEESLYKVNAADSSLVHWVDLGFGVGNMTLRQEDSCIYACAGGATDQIIKITSSGVVSVLSGISSGYQDGDISVALFTNPLGIAFSPNEDTLYISEAAQGNRLRRILFNQVADLFIPQKDLVSVYPNPATDFVHVHSDNEEMTVRISDVLGNCVLRNDLFFSNEGMIDVSHLNPGIYLMEILIDGVKTVKEIQII